mgnify:CR=1 FL=1
MKEKKTGLIQTLIGAIILVIGIVLCVNTYICLLYTSDAADD